MQLSLLFMRVQEHVESIPHDASYGRLSSVREMKFVVFLEVSAVLTPRFQMTVEYELEILLHKESGLSVVTGFLAFVHVEEQGASQGADFLLVVTVAV